MTSEIPVARDKWVLTEIEVLVAAYADMLKREMRGERVVKADAVRALEVVLPARTSGSIERKMQNVSAVLDEKGMPWIPGYKPLSHYQRDLAIAVMRTFSGSSRVAEALERYVGNAVPAASGSRLATEDVLIDPPSTRAPRYQGPTSLNLTTGPLGAIRDFRNAALGRAGEEWVIDLEREKLVRSGRNDLADRVSWVATVVGDGAGYDVGSFQPDGRPMKVEVKTTNLGRTTPFYITRWEVETSRTSSDEYALFRVFDFHQDPKLYVLQGSVEDSAQLVPSVFLGYPS